MTDPWIDRPIRSQAEDEFGRRGYAVNAAERIRENHTWEDSVVFSLTGAWGSGKTSMLAMVEEEVRRDRSWRIARFTPWATSDVPGLLGDFFASLASVLSAENDRQIREVLGEIVQLAAPAGHLIPYGGGIVAGTARRVGAALKAPRPLQDLFDNAMAIARTREAPVLVVVDDVDRLQAAELAELLKVVRLLGRFGGIHYLLAYDESTLFATLARSGLVRDDDAGAHRFMEKIVQYPLVVPDLTSYQLLRRLELGLSQALRAGQRSPLVGNRVENLHSQFRGLLPTPRAVDRYLAQIRHHLPLLSEDEINDEDFVVLTLLRVAFPLLYADLPKSKSGLTSGHTGELDNRQGSDWGMVAFDPGPLLATIPERLKSDAEKLLRDLFPALPSPGPRLTSASRHRSISDEQYFDRYFVMGLPDHDLSDAKVTRAIMDAARGSGDDLVDLLVAANVESAALALEKAVAVSESANLEDPARLHLLRVLLEQLGHWPETRDVFTSARRGVMRWCVSLVDGLSSAVDELELNGVLAMAPDFADRSELLYRVVRSSGGAGKLPTAVQRVLNELADEASQRLAEQIALGDDAAEDDDEASWLITFLYETGMGSAAHRYITEGRRAGRFAIGDIAARFVSIENHGYPKLARSRREEFAALVPVEQDDWYNEPIDSDVNLADVSWANRRRGAAGRFP